MDVFQAMADLARSLKKDPSSGLIIAQAIPQFLDYLLDKLLTFLFGHVELIAVVVGIDCR